MKRGARSLTRACLLLALLAFGAAHALAQTGPPPPSPMPRHVGGEWKEFISPEGRFSASMPGTPKLYTREQETVVGTLMIHSHLSVTPSGGFGVSYTDFPQPADSPEVVAAVLNSARDYVLAANKNRKLLVEREINVEGHPGREWLVVDIAGDKLFRAWTFVAGRRQYQVLLLTSVEPAFPKGQPSPRPEDRDAEYEAVSKKFFGSFNLLPAVGEKND